MQGTGLYPVFISEFGGEAMYGSNDEPADEAAYWSEGYQKQIYVDQIKMFNTIPNLCGVCPWLFFDYSSLVKKLPIIQTRYTAELAPMVYNDTIFLYISHDKDDAMGFRCLIGGSCIKKSPYS